VVARAARGAPGATVHPIHAAPDGWNINDGCGSTHPQALQSAVVKLGADAGIAHDGDADRCIAVDANGQLVDGDAILAICASARAESASLTGNAVATTVMTNLGFHHAMRAAGIGVVQTAVGDRYVLEALREHGLTLGGEQSGHLVFLDHATTGDGILTALQLLSRIAQTGRPLADLAAVLTRLPQVLVNVPVNDRDAAIAAPALTRAVEAASAELGSDGRVLVRPSGTESVVRVMVEATEEARARNVADRVAAALTEARG
jgi:phosphoglucosamine mutase